jgi:hypothetical protein
MSRATERAYDIRVRGDEKLVADRLDQINIGDTLVPDMALVTNGNGTLKLVPTSSFGGEGTPGTTLPTPPLGQNDALTADPAGVVQWGGTISAGSF